MYTYMKRITSLFIVVIMLISLVGCVSEQKNDSLTVYTNKSIVKDLSIDIIINSYKAQYPEVILNVIDFADLSQEEFNSKLTTELNAGKGPDVIFLDENFTKDKDVYKLIEAGAFANLSEYVKNDADYNAQDYNQNVMNIGINGDSKYVIPISYDIPLLCSTEELLQRDGVSQNDFQNSQALSKLLINNMKNNVIPNVSELLSYHELMGMSIFDYKKQQLNIDSEKIKPYIDVYKSIYNSGLIDVYDNESSVCRWSQYKNDKPYTFEFYGNKEDSYQSPIVDTSAMLDYSNPIFIPVVDENQKLHAKVNLSFAVRGSSKNQQNAYNFMKIGLSEVYQSNLRSSIPVNNTVLLSYLTMFNLKKTDIVEAGNSVGVGFQKKNGEIITLSFENGLTYLNDEQIKEYTNRYNGCINQIDTAYFPTPLSNKLYEYFIPYYKDEMSYEECLEQVKQQLQIYISE